MTGIEQAALTIQDAMTSIASIAVAVLVLLVTPKLFRWLRMGLVEVGIGQAWVDCPNCDYEVPTDFEGDNCPGCGSLISHWHDEEDSLDECPQCHETSSWDVWDANGGECPNCGFQSPDETPDDAFGSWVCVDCGYNADDDTDLEWASHGDICPECGGELVESFG